MSSSPQDFPEPKSTGVYIIPNLELDESVFLFHYFSVFLSYITPTSVPIDLLKDAFQSNVSLTELIFEAIQTENGLICMVTAFICISVIPLTILIVWCCTKEIDTTIEDLENRDTTPPLDQVLSLDTSCDKALHCRRRVLIFMLEIVILLLVVSISALILTNEQMISGADKTPEVAEASLKDAQIFLKDAHKQITLGLQSSVDLAIDRMEEDLNGIEDLLGKPIQRDLANYSQIGIIFEDIHKIHLSNLNISYRTKMLEDSLVKAMELTQQAAFRIEELQIQLSVLQKQCSVRDRPLCDTLQLKSFQDNGIVEIIQKLHSETKIQKLSALSSLEISGSSKNLSYELRTAQTTFETFPSQIKSNSSQQKADILQQLDEMRVNIQNSTAPFTEKLKQIQNSMDALWDTLEPIARGLVNTARFTWSLTLAIIGAVIMVTIIVMCGLSYGCCQAETRAGATFTVGAVFISIATLFVGGIGVFVLLLGAHAQVTICRPLYDSPKFDVIEKLFDSPGYMFTIAPPTGIINHLLSIPNVTKTPITTKLSSAIQHCEGDKPAFKVFQLESLLNVSKITDLHEYPTLSQSIENITVSMSPLSQFTLPMQRILLYMVQNTDANFSMHRTTWSQLTPEKDLITFIDQMQRVSLQIQDVATSSKMATLGNRARRVQTAMLQPLEHCRNDIMYHLTAMELHREHWVRMINQSIASMQTAQEFLNKDGIEIGQNRSIAFGRRLKTYLKACRHHVISHLMNDTATCRPLYNSFNANRVAFCRHTVDPLNGLWFVLMLCVTFWIMITPLSLALATIYQKLLQSRGLRHTSSHQAPSDTLMISEQSNWAAPSTPINYSAINAGNIDRSNW